MESIKSQRLKWDDAQYKIMSILCDNSTSGLAVHNLVIELQQGGKCFIGSWGGFAVSESAACLGQVEVFFVLCRCWLKSSWDYESGFSPFERCGSKFWLLGGASLMKLTTWAVEIARWVSSLSRWIVTTIGCVVVCCGLVPPWDFGCFSFRFVLFWLGNDDLIGCVQGCGQLFSLWILCSLDSRRCSLMTIGLGWTVWEFVEMASVVM